MHRRTQSCSFTRSLLIRSLTHSLTHSLAHTHIQIRTVWASINADNQSDPNSSMPTSWVMQVIEVDAPGYLADQQGSIDCGSPSTSDCVSPVSPVDRMLPSATGVEGTKAAMGPVGPANVDIAFSESAFMQLFFSRCLRRWLARPRGRLYQPDMYSLLTSAICNPGICTRMRFPELN